MSLWLSHEIALPGNVAHLLADCNGKQTHPDTFEITINGKKYDDRQKADEAIADAFKKIDKIGKEVKIGEFAGLNLYGIKEGQFVDGTYNKRIRITDGDKTISGFDSADSVAGITQKLSKTGKTLQKEQDKLEMAETDIKTLEKQIQGTFPREKVLNAKRKELNTLMKDLEDNPVPPPQWLVEGAPVMSDVLVNGKKGTVEGYRANPDDTFYVQVKEEGKDHTRLYPWQEVKDSQGLPMITAPEGVQESPNVDEIEYKAEAQEGKEEAEEKPSSNRKYSIDDSDNLGYNKEKVTDIKTFRNQFNPTTLRTWSNNHVPYSEQKNIFESVFKETGKAENALNNATSQADIDDIREKMKSILQEVVVFNKGGVLQSQQAVRVRIAREAFEHHEQVVRARIRVGQADKKLNQPAGNHGAGTQTANGSHNHGGSGAVGKPAQRHYGNVFNVSGERDDAEKHYRRLYDEQYESDKKLHPNEFVAEHSDNQGALSSAKHFSIDGKPIVGVRKYSAAWHGSPHKFDTFTLEAIGTGEGAQVHGYGLYFAKDRAISEGYRNRLAGKAEMPTFDEIVVDGQSLADMLDNAIENGDYEKQAMLENYETYDRDGVLKSAKEEGFDQEYIDWFNRLADKVEKQLPETPGSLFQVEIPDEDVMLDEQKPFDEQPEKVQKAIKGIFSELERMNIPASMKDEVTQYSKDVDLTGKDFYDFVRYCFSDAKTNALYFDQGAAKAASELLNKHGIKGITYEGRQDGRCYVVFDDEAIEIIQRLSVAKGKANKRSMDELKAEVKEAFPGAKVQESGNKLTFTMPNGQKVTVSLQENITVNEQEEAVAKASHGFDQSASVTIEGYAETVGAEGFIALSQGSREGTGFHEAYHIAEAMAFTKKELADAKRLISANEEERANEYAKWKLERKKHANFAKLWQKIADVAAKMAGLLGFETKRNIFRKVESGELYTRSNTASVKSRQYSLADNDNSRAGLVRKVKNIFSKNRAADTPEYRRMLKGMMEEIADIKIYYGKLDKGTLAIYDEMKGIIRAKNAHDWENIVPKFGAAVCKKLGIESTEEMDNYISDWVLTGAPNNTSQEAKTFQEAMRNNPRISEQMLDLQSAFDHWNKMSSMERMQAITSYSNQGKSSISDMLNNAYDQLIEELGPVKRLVQAVEKKHGTMMNALNPYVAFRLFRGHHGRAMTMIEGTEKALEGLRNHFPGINWDGFKTIHMILKEIGGLNNEKVRKEFESYCLACHLMDIHKANRRITQDIALIEDKIAQTKDKAEIRQLEREIEALEEDYKETPLSDPECAEIVRKYGDKYGAAQQDLVHYSDTMLAIMYNSGLIDTRKYRNLLTKWPNYVPMFRVFDDNDKVQFGDSMEAMTGSSRDIIEPLQSIIRNTFEVVKKAEKNQAKCLLANLARLGDVGKYIDVVDNAKPDDKTTLIFYENGRKKYLQTDPAVVAAVNGMGRDQSNLFMRLLRFPAQIARSAFTVSNPAFLIRNATRDMQDAFVYNDRGIITPIN